MSFEILNLVSVKQGVVEDDQTRHAHTHPLLITYEEVKSQGWDAMIQQQEYHLSEKEG